MEVNTMGKTREEWLQSAVDILRPEFAKLDAELPEKVYVSVGFPSTRATSKNRRRIGECWATKASADGCSHILVSPLVEDPVEVLSILTHELIHAWDDCQSGHKGPFLRIFKAFGLGGKPTASTAGDMEGWFKAQLDTLGPYPHSALSPVSNAPKQSTRMLKVQCPGCDYTVRTTAKWLEQGTPTCPCGEEMQAV
jgi:hypothetical protein